MPPPLFRDNRSMLPIIAALAACTPSSRDAAVSMPATGGPAIVSPGQVGSAPGEPADHAAEADGRLILSTAFVRIEPGGLLSVEQRDGGVLALRDVTLGARAYCGRLPSGARHCGRYGDVVAARVVAISGPAAVNGRAHHAPHR